MGKHTTYYTTQTKRTLTSSHDVYISSKGFLILNIPLCWLTHRHNTKPFPLFSKTQNNLFQSGISSKSHSLSTALKLTQTMQVMK